jgi:hypothetical protein
LLSAIIGLLIFSSLRCKTPRISGRQSAQTFGDLIACVY